MVKIDLDKIFILVMYFIFSMPKKYHVGNRTSWISNEIEKINSKKLFLSAGIIKIRIKIKKIEIKNNIPFKIKVDEIISDFFLKFSLFKAISCVDEMLKP